MKHLLITLLSVLGLFWGNGQAQENDWKKQNLKGRIQAIKTNTYKAKDVFGEIVKKELLYVGDDPSMAYSMIMHKDLLFLVMFSSHTIYYNDRGYMSSGNTLLENEKITLAFDYNNGNNLANIYIYNDDNKLANKIVYKDFPNNQVESRIYSQDSDDIKYSIHTYDNEGKMIKTYIGEEKFEYHYVYKGSLVEELIAKDKKKNTSEYAKIEYNSNDDIYRVIITDDDTEKGIYYEYTYDKYGNWIKRVNYKDRRVQSVTERIIQYYP